MPRQTGGLGDSNSLPSTSEQSWKKTFDEEGVPRTMRVEFWWDLLEKIMGSENSLKAPQKKKLEELARLVVRFSRPDGSTAFEPIGPRPDRLALFRTVAKRLNDPGLTTVCQWWIAGGSRGGATGPPPLPAFSSESRPIAMLRADWSKEGDFLAVDARDPSHPLIDLTIGGRPFLGPNWPSMGGKARLKCWKTSPFADCAEWSVGVGDSRVIRTVVLLRGRGLALLAEQRATDDHASGTMRIGLADQVDANPIAEGRALRLKSSAGGVISRVIPIGLDESSGSFVAKDQELSLISATTSAKRSWLPLLVSWDKLRNQHPVKWRQLTVSQNAKVCKPGVAFAARVSWGLGDSLVIYRSLGGPKPRTFLGYQTSDRFMIGTFSEEGKVTPLLRFD